MLVSRTTLLTTKGEDLPYWNLTKFCSICEDVEITWTTIDVQQKTMLPIDVRMEAIILPFTSGDISESSTPSYSVRLP